MKIFNFVVRIFLLTIPFWLPWWFVLVFVFAALFLFNMYWESILIGLILDTLYVTGYSVFGLYGFTLLTSILFVLVFYFKKKLVVY